ncbi:MAG TPA: hypothetical protein VGQ76_00715 [Thermoanaerobaculia bacterium]|jgi:hypothetical protein|nr:hypothetical protein [Thermoanaerobaculia bacterium]
MSRGRSPAERAGVAIGDRVVTWNGNSVGPDINPLPIRERARVLREAGDAIDRALAKNRRIESGASGSLRRGWSSHTTITGTRA